MEFEVSVEPSTAWTPPADNEEDYVVDDAELLCGKEALATNHDEHKSRTLLLLSQLKVFMHFLFGHRVFRGFISYEIELFSFAISRGITRLFCGDSRFYWTSPNFDGS